MTRSKLITWSDVLAGAGLITPGLIYGLWAILRTREGGGIEPSAAFFFICLLAAPLAVLLLGLLGRLVVGYLEAGESGTAERSGRGHALPKTEAG